MLLEPDKFLQQVKKSTCLRLRKYLSGSKTENKQIHFNMGWGFILFMQHIWRKAEHINNHSIFKGCGLSQFL
jgi:hypothetical protein